MFTLLGYGGGGITVAWNAAESCYGASFFASTDAPLLFAALRNILALVAPQNRRAVCLPGCMVAGLSVLMELVGWLCLCLVLPGAIMWSAI